MKTIYHVRIDNLHGFCDSNETCEDFLDLLQLRGSNHVDTNTVQVLEKSDIQKLADGMLAAVVRRKL